MMVRAQQAIYDQHVRIEGIRRNRIKKDYKNEDTFHRVNDMWKAYGAMLQGNAVGGVRGGGTVVMPKDGRPAWSARTASASRQLVPPAAPDGGA